jgi:hypothetical protein
MTPVGKLFGRREQADKEMGRGSYGSGLVFLKCYPAGTLTDIKP